MFGNIQMEMAKEDLRLKVKELKADTKLSDEERAVVKDDLLLDVTAFKQAIEETRKMPLFNDDLGKVIKSMPAFNEERAKKVLAETLAEHMEFVNELTMELKTIEIAGEEDMDIEKLRFEFQVEDTYKNLAEMVRVVKEAYNNGDLSKEDYDETKELLTKNNNSMRSHKGTEEYAPTPEQAKLVDDLLDEVDKLIDTM